MEEMLTVPEVAKLIGRSAFTTRKMARLGQLPAKKVGRDWRFATIKIARFIGEPVGGKAAQ